MVCRDSRRQAVDKIPKHQKDGDQKNLNSHVIPQNQAVSSGTRVDQYQFGSSPFVLSIATASGDVRNRANVFARSGRSAP